MKRTLKAVLLAVVLILGWATSNFFATTEGWLLTPLASSDSSTEFYNALEARAQSDFTGNLVYAIYKEGALATTQAFSKGRPVNQDTVFGVSSLSKWVTAVGVYVLVEQGKLDLDAPVSRYLKRWQLPESDFNNEHVTLRKLLSHTAGITDGLGHNGFQPGEPVQDLVSHLTSAQDADEGKSGKVQVGIQPGQEWMYSGGSYNLIQLIIEDTTGLGFAKFMQQAVFEPLGMVKSGYQVDREADDTAQYFAENMELLVYPNYTSLAATGLYTTLNDFSRFVTSQIDSKTTSADLPRLLSDKSLIDMRQAIAKVDGLEIWGAGPMLYAPTNTGEYIIGHGGQSPFLNSSARLDPTTGNAFIAFQTGNKNALASDLGTHWTTWLTGKPDIFILRNTLPLMIERIFLGSVFIVGITLAWLVFQFVKIRKTRRM